MKITDRVKWSRFSGKLFIVGAIGSAGAHPPVKRYLADLRVDGHKQDSA